MKDVTRPSFTFIVALAQPRVASLYELPRSHPERLSRPPSPGNLFGHRNDGTYGTPSIETGLARSEGINADNLLASRLRDIVFTSPSPCEPSGFLACSVPFACYVGSREYETLNVNFSWSNFEISVTVRFNL